MADSTPCLPSTSGSIDEILRLPKPKTHTRKKRRSALTPFIKKLKERKEEKQAKPKKKHQKKAC